jgi:hypothetical protein
MTDEGGRGDPDRVHERGGVGGEVVDRIAALRPLRVPVPALVWREGVVLR